MKRLFVGILEKSARLVARNENLKRAVQKLIQDSALLRNVISTSAQDAETSQLSFHYFSGLQARGGLPGLSVVITVFNNLEYVKICIESVKRTLPGFASIIVIDDGSDNETKHWLSKQKGFSLISNEQNYGYTKSVNIGLRHSGNDDVIILNSDCRVFGTWVGDMRLAAYSDASVGTVTALTDRPGSFGIFDKKNSEKFRHKNKSERESAYRWFIQNSESRMQTVPTGNGFCMYVKRELLDDIGQFDENLFPEGYGEENYFCMKAQRRGWRNVVTSKVLVEHAGSISFGARSKNLKRSGMATMEAHFPEYRTYLREFESDFFREARELGSRIPLFPVPEKRVMLITPIISGGTKHTNDTLVRSWRSQGFTVFTLQVRPGESPKLEGIENDEHFEKVFGNPQTTRVFNNSNSYSDSLVLKLVHDLSIPRVHIAHGIWQSNTLTSALTQSGRRVSFFAHDFESVCPSIYLLDEKKSFCGGSCTEGPGPCLPTFGSTLDFPILKNSGVYAWREGKSRFLEGCGTIFVASTFTAKTLVDNFPDIEEKIKILEHPSTQVDAPKFEPPKPSQRTKMLSIGNLGELKGSKQLAELSSLLDKDKFGLTVLGNFSQAKRANLEILGNYELEEFSEFLGGRKFSFGLLLSIMPETFSRTLDEMWSIGLPVVSFDLGAQSERIISKDAGWVVGRDLGARGVRDLIMSLIENPTELERKSENAIAAHKERSGGDYKDFWAKEVLSYDFD